MRVPVFWLLNLKYLKVISAETKFCTSQRAALPWVSQTGYHQTEGLVENLGIASPAETTAIWPGSHGHTFPVTANAGLCSTGVIKFTWCTISSSTLTGFPVSEMKHVLQDLFLHFRFGVWFPSIQF